ncbi:MAG: CRISPR-associated endoribonuclease Cas2 1 [Methanosaeta sp. PtaU1.Bin112]|nr:MAG: CRISPR-associated endoribonuclease Cas2 1 [Methanosaeta sp. PtaU1.Bin112]
MDTIVIYDISDNALRSKVARTLLEHGLVRIQKSAFYGFMNHNNREKLRLRLDRMMEGEEGNIQLYPLCSKCFNLRESIGETYEIKEEDVTVL